MSPGDLRHVAEGVTHVLDTVYDRDRGRSSNRSQEIVRSISSGSLHLFAILKRDSVVATTRLTRNDSTYAAGTNIVSYEGGGTAKNLAAAPSLKASALLAARYAWANQELATRADYLVSTPRVARFMPHRPFNGNILGQVLAHAPFIPAYAGYLHTVGQSTVEPFVHLATPFDLGSWINEIHQQTVYAPDVDGATTISQMLAESTADALRPPIVACPPTGGGAISPLYEVNPPGPTAESLYVMTRRLVKPGLRAIEVMPMSMTGGSTGISDRVVVEQDVVADAEDASRAYGFLGEQGFHLSGWACSAQLSGRLALVFGRPGRPAPGNVMAAAHLPTRLRDTSPTAYTFFRRAFDQQPQPSESLR